MEIEKTKEEIQKENKRLRMVILGGVVLGIIWSVLVGWFFSNYYLRSPIILQSPVMERYPKVSPTPKPQRKAGKSVVPVVVAKEEVKEPISDEERVKMAKNGDILWKVYGLESTWGRNDGCRDQGRFNGFGYGQNGNVWNCFESFEEVVLKVDKWFSSRLSKNGGDMVEALCFYNLGQGNLSNCQYYQKFLSL